MNSMHKVIFQLYCGILLVLALPVVGYETKRQYLTEYQVPGSSSHVCNTTCSSRYSDPASQTIQSLYASIVAADCELANPEDYPPHYRPTDGEEFDFIVVGGGTAGCVVANRLTEVYGWTVLLLEAGGDPTKTSEVPALYFDQQKTEVDWQYKTDPNENICLGFENRQCNWPAGKALGGSSSINGGVYIRANPRDYDKWEADGNIGWGYKDVLPYFKKFEDMRAKEVLNTPDFWRYHNIGGNLKVDTWPNEGVKGLFNSFAQGFREIGYRVNPDCNGRTQTGFAILQGALKDGKRCSSAKAFLSPIAQRPNLKVSKHSLATKILIDSRRTARGVEFIGKDGKVIRVRARKEVIVSAGTIRSPQLLMLSGVGPRKHLEDFNIDVIKDLPVGENLQDHPILNGLVFSLNYSSVSESPEESMFDFLFKKDSRYTEMGLNTNAMFLNTVHGVDLPDTQYFFFNIPNNDNVRLPKFLSGFGFEDEFKKQYLEINSNSYLITANCLLLAPHSKGRILLRSIDPRDNPRIFPGYVSDERDAEILLKIIDILYDFAQTNGMKSLNAELIEFSVSKCKRYIRYSREYRKCAMRYLISSGNHYSSTCRMGPHGSQNSVVDPDLRVKGIKGLRVIDTSILPNIPHGNTMAPTYMIGEKGSDLIKEAWLQGKEECDTSEKDSTFRRTDLKTKVSRNISKSKKRFPPIF